MIEHRIHYLINGTARCGHPFDQNWTIDPAKVTCGNCKRLMGKELQS